MKIAVATSVGDQVTHFGRAQNFSIYEFDEENYKLSFLENRETNIDLEMKHQWKTSLDLIKDCEIVICSQVGVHAKFGLEKKGIKVVQDEGDTPEVLDNYINHLKFMNKPLFK
ncbi:MAG: NifB/NifX family molybdenum-iron cluster-binding protein [Methanomicrobiales archaeon]